jgi:hypothetical protein
MGMLGTGRTADVLLDDLGRRPWRIASHARTLAALVRRLCAYRLATRELPAGEREAIARLAGESDP